MNRIDLIRRLRSFACGLVNDETFALLTEAADALEQPRDITGGHPWLVDRWTVGGDTPGEYALVYVFCPPGPDGKPIEPCDRLRRAKDDASFVGDGWLDHEREVVRRVRSPQG